MIEREPGKLSGRTLAILVIVLAGFYWVGTWSVSLFDRDEPRFAQPAKEMRFADFGRDWIVPHLNGEPHFHKPPLCYWQTAAAFMVFGVNDFSARFFPGLWTAVTAGVLGAWLARRFSVQTGLIGAMAFGTSLMVVAEAKLGISDATLGLATVVAALSLWDVFRGTASLGTRLALWVAAGLAILVKGPVIFIVLGGVVIFLLIVHRPRRWVFDTGFYWGIPLMLLIGLPWYVAAEHLSEGQLSARFWGYDLVKRVTQAVEGHRGFPGFYIATALFDSWPWSAFLIPVGIFARQHRSDPDVKFLLAWLIGPTVILECVQTKMVHYWLVVLPAYVILFSLMFSGWLSDPEQVGWRRWRKPVTWVVAGVWLVMLAVVMAGQRWVFESWTTIHPAFPAVLAASAVLVLWAGCRQSAVASFYAIVLSAVLVALTLYVFVLPGLEPYKFSRQLAQVMKKMGNDETTYALIGWQEESTIYYLHSGRRNVLTPGPGQYAEVFRRPNTVIGVSEKYLPAMYKVFTHSGPSNHRMVVQKGYDYTQMKGGKLRLCTVYVFSNATPLKETRP